jgi:hypothetical protein
MSQRERLLGRRVPPTRVAIRVDFSPEADAAFAAHEEAVRDLRTAEFRTADLEQIRARVAETKAALAQYQEILLVSAVAANEYDELIGAHPPTDKQREDGFVWNPDTFVPALLAACIGQELPEAERMSEKDWIDWTTTASAGVSGELVALYQACLQVNDRRIDMHVGKD